MELLEDDVDKAFSQMNYSTQEHVVGEWVDGKAVYERTYFLENLHVGSNTIPVDYVDTPISLVAYSVSEDTQGRPSLWQLQGPTDVSTNDSNVRVLLNEGNIVVIIGAWNAGMAKCVITMRYTKL